MAASLAVGAAAEKRVGGGSIDATFGTQRPRMPSVVRLPPVAKASCMALITARSITEDSEGRMEDGERFGPWVRLAIPLRGARRRRREGRRKGSGGFVSEDRGAATEGSRVGPMAVLPGSGGGVGCGCGETKFSPAAQVRSGAGVVGFWGVKAV